MEHVIWKQIVAVVRREHAGYRSGRDHYSDADIILTYFRAVLHDRPVSWACCRSNWPVYDRRRPLPTPSTMSRRLRTESIRDLLVQLEDEVHAMANVDDNVFVIDGKSLPIGGNSSDPDAGYGRAAGGKAKGYKLHVLMGLSGVVRCWEVRPMNHDERTVAREMLADDSPRGVVLADSNYDANYLYDLLGARGAQLLAYRRYGSDKALGHRRHSDWRLECVALLEHDTDDWARRLLEQRDAIERFFGTLTCASYGLGPLPAWVRRHHRVRQWVHAKLIIFAISRTLKRAA